jgi:hypothetical protein
MMLRANAIGSIRNPQGELHERWQSQRVRAYQFKRVHWSLRHFDCSIVNVYATSSPAVRSLLAVDPAASVLKDNRAAGSLLYARSGAKRGAAVAPRFALAIEWRAGKRDTVGYFRRPDVPRVSASSDPGITGVQPSPGLYSVIVAASPLVFSPKSF